MKQITEDFVSFEIAKLLKEKGFDNEEVSENGGFYCDYKCDGTDIGIVYESEMLNKELARNEYLRPTHQMALKWLREVHKIVVCISPMQEIDGDCIEWCAEIYKIVGEKGLSLEDEIYWDSYEEAQNEALKYTLENLI